MAMASFFITKNDGGRQRAVSNGGLGGFVTIGSIRVMETSLGDGKSTWPRNRKRKKNVPPPISIIRESDKFFIKQEILSPSTIVDDTPMWSPMTPISRYNPLLSPSSVYNSHLPPPPLTPKHQLLPSALELPGSLLLPSQGFPQSNPPSTPARPQPCLSRSSSEESERVWTPARSISSSTDIEDDAMPKSFPPMHLPRAIKPSKPRNSSAPPLQELGIGKPLSAMSAEELLDELPHLSSESVKSIWIPAMITQHNRLKKLLQDAADVRLDQGTESSNPSQLLEAISRDARKISHTYEKAINSAESLVERDSKLSRDRLEIAQNNLQAALSTIDNTQQIIRQREDTVQQLRYTLDDIVRVLGQFIQDHTPLFVLQNDDQDDVRDVTQILADYGYGAMKEGESKVRFLRIPQDHYMASIDALRESQLKTERFREVAISQNQVISEQSMQLDSRMSDYEKSIEVIAERNNEVRLLANDNKQYQKVVEDFQTGLRVSNSTRAVQDELFRDQQAMQFKLRDMQEDHAKDLRHKDTVIANLEKKLRMAEQEVLRGKADVKNVITHTQALLSPAPSPRAFPSDPPTLKERRFMSKGKGKSAGLPSSQSMLLLGQQGQKSQAPAIPERRQSANVLLKSVDQPTFAMLPRDVTPQWGCGVPQKMSSQDLRDLSNFSPNYAPRPRTDLLGLNHHSQRPQGGDQVMTSAVVNQMFGGTPKFDANKRLPDFPEPHCALELYGGDNAKTMNQVQDWYQQKYPQQNALQTQQPDAPKPSPGSPIAARKRVLSQITERSGEDSTTASTKGLENDAVSVTSSTQEEYLKELSSGRMRDFIQQTNDSMKHRGKVYDMQATPTPDYEGRDYYPAEPRLTEGDVGVARTFEVIQSPVKVSRSVKMYQTSVDGSSSSTTKKNDSPLRDVDGIRIEGDPWLSGSPSRL